MVCVCVGGGCWVKVAAGVSPTLASDTTDVFSWCASGKRGGESSTKF